MAPAAVNTGTEVETVNVTALLEQVGCSYRQLNYWVRLGLIHTDDGQKSPGTGFPRRFDRQALFLAKVVTCLSGFGFHGEPLRLAVRNIREHSPAARMVYVKQDGSTDWSPGVPAAIVIDLDQFRLKSESKDADR